MLKDSEDTEVITQQYTQVHNEPSWYNGGGRFGCVNEWRPSLGSLSPPCTSEDFLSPAIHFLLLRVAVSKKTFVLLNLGHFWVLSDPHKCTTLSAYVTEQKKTSINTGSTKSGEGGVNGMFLFITRHLFDVQQFRADDEVCGAAGGLWQLERYQQQHRSQPSRADFHQHWARE